MLLLIGIGDTAVPLGASSVVLILRQALKMDYFRYSHWTINVVCNFVMFKASHWEYKHDTLVWGCTVMGVVIGMASVALD